MSRSASAVVVVVVAAAVVAVSALGRTAAAKEVDQLSDRRFQLANLRDGSAELDAGIDRILGQLLHELNAQHPATQLARDRLVYRAFQGSSLEVVAQLATPYETWVRDEADVDLFWVDDRGIYGGAVDYRDMGMGWYVEIAPVVRIGRSLVGIDKLGHFLGNGWFYYADATRLREADPLASDAERHRRLLAYGHAGESTYLGSIGTGVYSYADLAANWQGYQFYRQLFGGDHPYFVPDGDGRWRLARAFHFADYVTDDWDEVLTPSSAATADMFAKVADYVRVHVCGEYAADPTAFLAATGTRLPPADYVPAEAPTRWRFDVTQLCQAPGAAPASAVAPRSTAPPAAP